mgnify:FL=1
MNTPLPYPSQSDPATRRAAANPVDWRRHLPARWADRVVEALDFTRHVEYEMPAWRVQGHDADGALCFYAHDYLLTEGRSDNDEDFYTVVTAGEAVHAWRLYDDRWLIYRRLRGDDEHNAGRPFYSFSDRPPR